MEKYKIIRKIKREVKQSDIWRNYRLTSLLLQYENTKENNLSAYNKTDV